MNRNFKKNAGFIPYGHQWIDEEDIKEVVKVLKGDWITQGSKVDEFEKAVARYCKAEYGIAFSSGTAALHAACAAAGIGIGDEVITTPLTFAATANAIVYCGGKPIFADIQKDFLNIDPEEIEKKITNLSADRQERLKAIVPVDLAGHPCNYDKIKKIAQKYKLLIIEDAAQALGSVYRGRRIGSLADMTVFSFHPVKTITTGEGGMILTNNKGFYEKLKIFRNHGIVKKPKKGGWYYEIKNPGFNYRLTDFQCALGISQLKKLDKFVKRRKEIVDRYNKAFSDLGEIVTPNEREGVKSAWHIYIIQLVLEKLKVDRKKIFERLQKEKIGVQVHHVPVHLHPFYKEKFGYKKGDFPITERYYERAITLPLFPKMSNKEIERVIKIVKKIISFYTL